MYDRILLATDGSERAQLAADHAIGLSARFDGTLYVLSAVETRTAYDSAIIERDVVQQNLRESATETLDDVEQLADDAGVPTERLLVEGVPSECIVSAIDEHDIDLVILGERGHSSFKTVLLGSTTEAVLYNTDIPVTVV